MKRKIGLWIICLLLLVSMTGSALAEETDGGVAPNNEVITGDEVESPDTGNVNEEPVDSGNQTQEIGDVGEIQNPDQPLPENSEETDSTAEDVTAMDAGSTTPSSPIIQCRVHRQTYGWTDYQNVSIDTILGTTGESKRLEAIQFRVIDSVTGQEYDKTLLDVQCSVHVQTYGWQDYKGSNEICGTEGESKRLEALKIKLTGSQADQYSIFYSTHIQQGGWLDVAKDDALAGSSGFSLRMEAVKIALLGKADTSIATGNKAFIQANSNGLVYSGHVQTYGDIAPVVNGNTLGTTGQSKRMEAIVINYNKLDQYDLDGDIIYSAHVQTYGWINEVGVGAFCGTRGESKRLEAISIRLTGDLATYYNIYYRVHAQSVGWMDWAKNGENAGTSGCSKRLEAIQIQLLPKTVSVPSSGSVMANYMTTSRNTLVNFVYSKLGTAYVYGGVGEVLTMEEYWRLKGLYGGYVWDSDISKVGQVVVDCSGLIDWCTGIWRDSRNFYDTAVERVPMSSLNESMIGWALYKPGHIGIYVGNGYYIAADGSRYGVRKARVSSQNWTCALKLRDIVY